MEELTVGPTRPSTPCWEHLEAWIRQQLQSWLQQLLEEELTEFLGREKSQRRPPLAPSEPGAPETAYRNGHGKPRRLTTPCGTVELRRPRVRGLTQRFESRLLPFFQRKTPGVAQLLPELYLHGLASGDLDRALRGLLGEHAPLSPATLARLKAEWQQEYDAWNQRSLSELPVVYLWVDGIYVKAGLEQEKAALLVVLGALTDGSKVVLAVQSGHRESTESWTSLLRGLKGRGLCGPQLVIGDGALGIWGALANVFPEAGEQRCWNHRQLNVLDRLPKSKQVTAKVWLRQLMYAPTRAAATQLKGKFQAWCRQQGQAKAGELLDQDWERLVAYYDFPQPHWKHLRTTNPVESPFAAVRLRTTAAKRYRKVENATAVIWKTLMLAERQFRTLNAAELLPAVAAGKRYLDGRPRWPEIETQPQEEKVAA